MDNSMDNNLSYCGLADPRISASDKDLPVHRMIDIYLMVKVAKCQKVFVPSSKSMQEITVHQILNLKVVCW